MTTSDDPFGLRIVANFDHVIAKISVAIYEIKSPQFFDFVTEFVKKFSSHFSKTNIATLL